MTDKLTEEDICSLVYFHEERDDMTRGCDWEEMKPRLAEHHPMITQALVNLELAQKTLDMLMTELGDSVYDN